MKKFIDADLASIEAELEQEIRGRGSHDLDLDALSEAVATRLGASLSVCREIVSRRLASSWEFGAPPIERCGETQGSSRSLTHPRDRASMVPGKQTRVQALWQARRDSNASIAVQRKASGAAPREPDSDEPFGSLIGQAGSPIPDAVRADLERVFRTGLESVQIRSTESSAKAASQIGAKAFTVGQDIYFGAGQLDTATREGRELLAHEVAHTIQNKGQSATRPPFELTESGDSVEREADAAATSFSQGETFNVGQRGTGATVARDVGESPPSLSSKQYFQKYEREISEWTSWRLGALPPSGIARLR